MHYSAAREEQMNLLHRLRTNGYVHPDLAAQAPNFKGRWATTLMASDPYYFSPPVLDLISHASKSLPDTPFVRGIVPDDLGFWWFANAVSLDRHDLTETNAGFGGLRAISWATAYDAPDDPAHPMFYPLPGNAPSGLGPNARELHVTWWIETNKGVQPLTNLRCLFGSGWASGGELTHSGRSPDEVESATLRKQKLAVFMGALIFLKQHIIVRHREPLDRAARRRLGDNAQPDTTVIYLRRVHKSAVDGNEPRAVDWACRWWVAGHWREQRCGHRGLERRPTWINPHIKGPDDKPVKTSHRLYAVVR